MIDKSTLDSCLQGISFPVDGSVLVECATANSCPRDVISQVQSLPSRTFSSQDELLCRLGNSDYCHLN
jgi:hypothetical protein